MSEAKRSTPRLQLSDESRPKLARHARLKFDKVREQWVLLVPERVMVPDETAVEILNLCDGERSIAGIVDVLAEKYAAERELIRTDVTALLQDLMDKNYLAVSTEDKQ